jgi:small-conductance mechanosensitive channel
MFAAALFLRRVGVARLKTFAARTSTAVDDFVASLIGHTHIAVLAVVSAFVGTRVLALPAKAERIAIAALMIAIAVQALIWAHQIVNYALASFMRRRQVADEPALAAGLGIAKFILLMALYAIILLFALSNMGVNITAWVTGLGIGGIAIALAVQNVLGDLFASLSIVLDKPFTIGDFIIVGDKMGTVERIGIKTTRLRSLSGEQLVLSNSDLLSSRIQNFKRMSERRVVFGIGVVYQTPLQKLKLVSGIITAAVKAQAKTRLDRCHFKSFGACSLDFETVYYVLDADYNLSMDIQQAINLEIIRRFEDEGIAFAYPTQTLYVVPDASPELHSSGRAAG